MSTAATQEFLTIEELAQRLKLSVSGVKKMQARRLIPVVKLGSKCARYSWQAVQAALAKVTVREM
ncbi:MAG TPA: hypothetical protein VGO11_19680 [Chthoniobacteraceae bacterium]|jgi:excisionase family DNA binding protein|nr:hypothetical protein [Chthoniobacteraceae bacterium]